MYLFQMAYCPTPRTGLTVWNRYFAALAHLPYWPQWLTKMWLLVRNIYNMPSCLSRMEMMQIVNNSLTFTFVRHPFVRLVAVFNDRVVSSNFNGWQAEIQKRHSAVVIKKLMLFFSKIQTLLLKLLKNSTTRTLVIHY
jgi:hypothetical protein